MGGTLEKHHCGEDDAYAITIFLSNKAVVDIRELLFRRFKSEEKKNRYIFKTSDDILNMILFLCISYRSRYMAWVWKFNQFIKI